MKACKQNDHYSAHSQISTHKKTSYMLHNFTYAVKIMDLSGHAKPIILK